MADRPVFVPGSLSLFKPDLDCHGDKTDEMFESALGWDGLSETPYFLTRYVDTSLLTVTFLSISVDLLIFIIFTFAYQMANYDMRFWIEHESPQLYGFTITELKTSFEERITFQ